MLIKDESFNKFFVTSPTGIKNNLRSKVNPPEVKFDRFKVLERKISDKAGPQPEFDFNTFQRQHVRNSMYVARDKVVSTELIDKEDPKFQAKRMHTEKASKNTPMKRLKTEMDDSFE